MDSRPAANVAAFAEPEPGRLGVSVVDALTAAIREQVLTGAIPAESALRETELSRAFGVGRNSFRAALQVLVHEGLLRHAPHRGVFVPRLSDEDVRDLFRLRAALETEVVRELATSPAALEVAATAADRLAAVSGLDRPSAIALDLEFHRALVEATGSRRLRAAFRALLSELQLSFLQRGTSYGRPGHIAASHAALLDVIRRGEAAAAERAMRQHLAEALDEMLVEPARGLG